MQHARKLTEKGAALREQQEKQHSQPKWQKKTNKTSCRQADEVRNSDSSDSSDDEWPPQKWHCQSDLEEININNEEDELELIELNSGSDKSDGEEPSNSKVISCVFSLTKIILPWLRMTDWVIGTMLIFLQYTRLKKTWRKIFY